MNKYERNTQRLLENNTCKIYKTRYIHNYNLSKWKSKKIEKNKPSQKKRKTKNLTKGKVKNSHQIKTHDRRPQSCKILFLMEFPKTGLSSDSTTDIGRTRPQHSLKTFPNKAWKILELLAVLWSKQQNFYSFIGVNYFYHCCYFIAIMTAVYIIIGNIQYNL